MSNIDNFKTFVKNHPSFATYIKDGTMTWQKFYELYDMYGESSSIWNEYKDKIASSKKSSTTLNDVIKFCEHIYPNEDFIILNRKYLKYKALRLELEENGEGAIKQ